MKKLLFVVMGILLLTTLFAQTKTIDHTNGYYLYFNMNNTLLTEEEYLNYAKVFKQGTYRQYHNDEFEWEEKYSAIKQELDTMISKADFDAVYSVVSNIELGDYDFTNEGYSVSFDPNSFFPIFKDEYAGYAQYASSGSVFGKIIAIIIDSLETYSILPMPKEEAKAFLQGRKDKNGKVNRSVTMQINYKIVRNNSLTTNSVFDRYYIPIVGVVESIEIYDTSDSQNIKKIGELTQN